MWRRATGDRRITAGRSRYDMTEVKINNFLGIAPKFGSNLKVGGAVTAENIDLSDGKIKAMADDLLIEATPEPATVCLFALGGLGLLRRKK